MSTQVNSLIARMAARLGVDQAKLYESLTKVAFPVRVKNQSYGNKSQETITRAPTSEELLSLLVVCEQYELNPFTRQIFAFLSKSGVVVPVVSIDGWLSILNRQVDYDGMDIDYSDKLVMVGGIEVPEFCQVRIYRKSLSKPISISEFSQECFVERSEIWRKYPRRMLRHKALIQAIRVAFSISGIYDEEEAKNFDGFATEVLPANVVEKETEVVSSNEQKNLLPSQTQEQLLNTTQKLVRLAKSHPENGWQRAFEWAKVNLVEPDCRFVCEALEKEQKQNTIATAQTDPTPKPAPKPVPADAQKTAPAVEVAPEVFANWDKEAS